MDLKGFLESSDTFSLTNPGTLNFIYKIPVGGGYYVLLETECVASDRCDDLRFDKTFFKGGSDKNDASVKKLYFLYKDNSSFIYNQNSLFWEKILGLTSSVAPSPDGISDTGMIDYSIENANNLCSVEAVCGLLAAFPDAVLPFFKDLQRETLGLDNFQDKLKLSVTSSVAKQTLEEGLPNFLKSLEVHVDTLPDTATDGFIEFLPEYYPYKSGCAYMYSIQNIISKLFYDKEKCLILNHRVKNYIKRNGDKFDLYDKKTDTSPIGNIMTIGADGILKLDGGVTELIPTLDFVKISEDRKYCLFTLVRNNFDLVSQNTSKEELQRIFRYYIEAFIPGAPGDAIEILGGVGEHYTDSEGLHFGDHILFFVCSPSHPNVIIGDSKEPVLSADTHFLRPRILLLSLKPSASSLASSSPSHTLPVTPISPSSRKTLKKSSRGFHKTKRVRFYE